MRGPKEPQCIELSLIRGSREVARGGPVVTEPSRQDRCTLRGFDEHGTRAGLLAARVVIALGAALLVSPALHKGHC